MPRGLAHAELLWPARTELDDNPLDMVRVFLDALPGGFKVLIRAKTRRSRPGRVSVADVSAERCFHSMQR